MGRRHAAVLLACVLLTLAAAASARASDTPIGTGDLPSAVTDRDGTAHVVWLETNAGGTADTVTYCQIPRGSVTCASTQHLIPTCADGSPAPAQHRFVGGISDGDSPKVMVSQFGDVYVVTHGTCPIDWGTSQDPWHSEHGIDREIVFHSTDDGATFLTEGGQARAFGSRSSAASANSNDTSLSSTLYDAADSRLVTTEFPSPGGSYHSSETEQDGIFVLGRQDDLIVNDPDPPSTAEMQRGLLANDYVNNQAHVGSDAPSLTQRARGSFAVAYEGYESSGSPTIFIRTFDCAACQLDAISDSANWGAEIALPAGDLVSASQLGARVPQLVSGPAGTFLLYENDAADGRSSTVYQFWIRKLDGTTLGPRHLVISGPVEASHQPPTAQLVQDSATGHLSVTYATHPQTEMAAVTEYVTSDDAGVSWTAPVQLGSVPAVPSSTNYQPVGTEALSLSTGDEGFTGLVIRSGPLITDGNGNPARGIYVDALPGSGQPGTGTGGGGTVGGGTVGGGGGTSGDGSTGGGGGTAPNPAGTDACRVKQFGPLDILADACLQVDPSSGAIIAKGHVRINGLELVGKEVRFDLKARSVTSDGPVTVSIGDTKLFTATLDWKLPAGNIFTLPSIDTSALGGLLKGFPLEGSADIKLVRGAVEIPLQLALPKEFGAITGDVTVRADNLAGIHLRAITVSAPKALVGPVEFDNLTFSYDPDQDNWSGGATIKLPPAPPSPALRAEVGFVHGGFDYARGELTFPGDGLPLDDVDLTHLTKIRFSVALHPDLKFSGGVTLSSGPKFGDDHVAEINGDLTFTFPDGKPAILRADGTLSLLTIPVATAYLQFKTDGQVNFGGHLDYSVDPVAIHGGIDGWILPFKSFSVDGKVRVCLGDLGCDGGEVVVSSIGMAACVSVAGADVGAGYKWGPLALWTPAILAGIDVMWHGCSVSDYQPAAPPIGARTAAATRVMQIPAGLPFAVFSAVGMGAAPHVALSGPGGRRITAPASGPLRTPAAVVFHTPKQNTTYFIIHHPVAGAWRIVPLPDSVPVISDGHGNGLPSPSIHAHVTGRGNSRVLHYAIKPLPGQSVTFEEHGKDGSGALGKARRTRGTLAFHPALGGRERRTIVAMVSSFGRPRTALKVARYTSPGLLRPARPKGLTVKRNGSTLLVTWKRLTGIRRYRLLVRLSDGRVLLLVPTARATRATVKSVAARLNVTVSLQGESTVGTTGLAARGQLGKTRHR